MSKRLCVEKTIDNENSASFSSISIQNIVIQSPSTYPAYTLTLPLNAGIAGQVLTTNGYGVLSWSSGPGVQTISVTSPITSTGGQNPTIGLSTVPTTLGGTGLTTVGTNGQVLQSNGTNLQYVTLPTPVTAVSGSSPINSSGGTTPTISLSTVPTTLGGTGLTTIGTNGQVLQSNGTNLQYVTLPTPVTAVSGSSPITSSGGTTPTISLSTVPTTLGGTGLTTVGTNNQVLTSNGTSLFWSTPTTGTVTSVTASSPLFSSGGNTPNLTLSTVPTTLGGTGLTSVGSNGQVLTSNGTSLSWQTPAPPGTGTVTTVSASVPSWLSVTVTNPTTTPAIAITGSATGTGTVSVLQDSPTINTLLTVSGQINVSRTSSNGLGMSVYNTDITYPTSSYIAVGRNSSGLNHTHFGTIINGNNDSTNYGYIQFNSNQIRISGTGNVTIPSLTLTTALSTANGGTGITTVGTANQVLTSNGTSLYWTTPTTGTVTSVSATSPLASSGGSTPTISISSSTGTGAVMLADFPIALGLISDNSLLTRSTVNNTYVIVSAANGVYGTIEATDLSTATKRPLSLNPYGGNVGIGYPTPFTPLHVLGAPAAFGIQYLSSSATLSSTINTVDILQRWYESTGNASYIDLSWVRTSAGGNWLSAGQRFQSKVDNDFQAYIQFNGNNNYGLSFGTGFSTTATGVAERMRITETGNVGIGTTAPSVKFHVVNGTGDTGIFEASTNYGCMVKWVATATNGRIWKLQSTAIGDGEHPAGAFVIDDGTAGIRRFVINAAGNISIGVTPAISSFKLAVAGAGYFNSDGQNLVLDGASHSYTRWRVGGNDYGFMGYHYGGSKDMFIYNQRTDGYIILDMANTAGAIRCVKNILLQETVYIKIGTASSSYDFILPTSPGTAGQYLISGGAGSPMYWGSGGGGGGGTVNSVTASSPLASSGGTSPNISIASATGTGAVVLQNNPTVTSDFHVSQTSSFGNNVGIEVVRSGDPTPANNVAWYQYIPTGSADYRFYNTSIGNLMSLKVNGNVGIGTTSPSSLLHTKVTGTGVTNTLTIEAGTGNSTANVAKLALNTLGGGGGAINQGIESIYDSGLGFYGLKISTETLLNVYSSASSRNAMRLVADSSNTFLYLQAASGSNQTGISFMDSSNVPKSGFTQTSAGFSMVSSLPNMGISCPIINFSSFPATQNCYVNLKANAVTFTITTFTTGETEFNSTQNDTIFTRSTIFKGGELLVYKQTYSDPDSGTGYTAKFGSASGNGIAVRGNSKFLNSVIASNFTTNSVDFFTYEEVTFSPIIAFHTYNYNGDGLIVTDVNGYFNFWNYTVQQGKIVRIGNNVTITWNIEFSYANNIANLYMVIPLGYSQFRSNVAGASSVGFPTSLNNLTNASNYGVCGVYIQNISYNGNPRTGICVTGRESSGWYAYYSGGSMSNQRLSGSVSYNIL